MLTMEDLKSRDCRWPAEAQNGEMLFCGEPTLNGCPYCAVHADIAYHKPARNMIKRAATRPPLLAATEGTVEGRER
jgi:hypothetical protein